MSIKLAAMKSQEINFLMRRNDIVEFEDGHYGVVNNVVTKKTPRATLTIHTIKLNGDAGWRAAVKINRKH
jgi:hypothetical protein